MPRSSPKNHSALSIEEDESVRSFYNPGDNSQYQAKLPDISSNNMGSRRIISLDTQNHVVPATKKKVKTKVKKKKTKNNEKWDVDVSSGRWIKLSRRQIEEKKKKEELYHAEKMMQNPSNALPLLILKMLAEQEEKNKKFQEATVEKIIRKLRRRRQHVAIPNALGDRKDTAECVGLATKKNESDEYMVNIWDRHREHNLLPRPRKIHIYDKLELFDLLLSVEHCTCCDRHPELR